MRSILMFLNIFQEMLRVCPGSTLYSIKQG